MREKMKLHIHCLCFGDKREGQRNKQSFARTFEIDKWMVKVLDFFSFFNYKKENGLS